MPKVYWVSPSWPITAFRSTPSCLMTLRCTSTMRTCSITWSLPATLIMFSTFSGDPTNWAAIRAALSDSEALRTTPLSTTLSRMGETVILASGMILPSMVANWSTG